MFLEQAAFIQKKRRRNASIPDRGKDPDMTYYWDGAYENTEDDWTDLKTKGPDGLIADTDLLYPADDVPGWESAVTGWVGEGDSIDYLKFTLLEADLVSFTVSASDKVNFM